MTDKEEEKTEDQIEEEDPEKPKRLPTEDLEVGKRYEVWVNELGRGILKKKTFICMSSVPVFGMWLAVSNDPNKQNKKKDPNAPKKRHYHKKQKKEV
jgi:hypothetical protein